MKKNKNSEAEKVRRWFEKSVTFDGKKYTIDSEQAAAVADLSKNTIVVARAGSGKTRTIVAKIVYLIAKCGVKPDDIMAFVFNVNAAAEINARLAKMRVLGKPLIKDEKIASTFHAFSRKVVYELSDEKENCGRILAGRRDELVFAVVYRLLDEEEWGLKIRKFVNDDANKKLGNRDLVYFSHSMSSFIDRAQQRFLVGDETLEQISRRYLEEHDVGGRERLFVEIGVECFKRYHWYLLDLEGKNKLWGFKKYGTDFNLLMSWASKVILRGDQKARELLANKKYVLIDEYQDFSQLFLMVVSAIRKVAPDVRLFVVGDDWQAINRFAGSDVEYFKEFEKYFPEDAKKFEITTNYRCDYAIVEAARNFMQKSMKEKGHFRAKSWHAGKVVVVNPMEVKLWEIVKREKAAESIMILHRNNDTQHEGSLLEITSRLRREMVVRQRIMKVEEFNEKIKVMTMHRAKGLEAEVVVILEADEGVIPREHPDTILYGMFGETEKIALDDQKRLFYVALTRAKKRLYIMHRTDNEGFIKYLGRGVKQIDE